jgi:hypothetical protein
MVTPTPTPEPSSPYEDGSPAGAVADQHVEWRAIVEMDNQLFPSQILATADARQRSPKPTYIGDVFGNLGALVTPETHESEVQYAPDLYCDRAVLMKQLDAILKFFDTTLSTPGKPWVDFKMPNK